METSDAPALAARRVIKHFGAFRALAGVDFDVRAGEIHVLLGENGAGKSTLMHVLYGMVRPDGGEVLRDGHPLRLRGPGDAMRAGVGMVHQHFMLVPRFTVAENLALGWSRSPRLDLTAVAREAEALARRFGLEIDARTRVEDLPVGAQQRVEILKALWRGARVLILDEPTAVLAPAEVEGLFAVLADLRSQGIATVLITHKLAEALGHGDRVTVLRRGAVVGTMPAAEADAGRLAEMMVGRAVETPEPAPVAAGAPVLEVRDLRFADGRGAKEFRVDALEVRAGEIVGVAGVDGGGQRELAEILVGTRKPLAGMVRFDGRDLLAPGPKARRAAGVAVVPADRREEGLVLDFDLAENAVLGRQDAPRWGPGPFLSRGRAREAAARLIEGGDVRAPGPDAPASSLSGGNQQKFLVARELDGAPRLLVAVNPTRGVDVGAAADIHRRLVARRAAGLATLLVSTELDEILALSDRVAVLFGGRMSRLLARREATRERVGAWMAGVEETDSSKTTSPRPE